MNDRVYRRLNELMRKIFAHFLHKNRENDLKIAEAEFQSQRNWGLPRFGRKVLKVKICVSAHFGYSLKVSHNKLTFWQIDVTLAGILSKGV